jgi:hypothetical protein
MHTKPILFWPKRRSEIELTLGRGADDFLVIDTNCDYDLQKLHKLRSETPVFDPFPTVGDHYRDYSDHVIGSDCHCRVLGLEVCQRVLRALDDPSLTRSSIEDLVLAISLPSSIEDRSAVIVKRTIDWSYLNWKNTALAAALVCIAALIGNALSRGDGVIAAVVAAFVFSILYVCARVDGPHLLPSARRAKRKVIRLVAATFAFGRSGRGRRMRSHAQHAPGANLDGRAKLTLGGP